MVAGPSFWLWHGTLLDGIEHGVISPIRTRGRCGIFQAVAFRNSAAVNIVLYVTFSKRMRTFLSGVCTSE